MALAFWSSHSSQVALSGAAILKTHSKPEV
jgi:hypothetical protein